MKSVRFNLENTQLCDTYSNDEYDRYPIHSVLYLKSYNKISELDWKVMLYNLNIFKISEMIVHKSSINNTKLN
jgi:hypothetical protein